MTVAIPKWNAQGVVPPIDPADPTSFNRSPYEVSLVDLIKTYGTSPERRAILKGFLAYRAALHALGLVEGFQWINGSFSEDVEKLEDRHPKDIDVVSHFDKSSHIDLSATGDLFAHDIVKNTYRVDAYTMELEALLPREVVFWSAYWYSMWSHRRNQNWKGFLQVDLAPAEDGEAAEYLRQFDVPQGATS
ncbi:hypothetical protein V8G57_02575 [Collimonas sp. H4R21]|uniref:Uncharacterized protein n=1 Tax=Collimonas rhizosphaerae TaxID=3126357 RepID=A0ABU9PQI8_9BURK